jgi:hypothetical protein
MELADGLVVSGGAIIESGARFRRSPRKASFLPDSFGSPLPSELKFYARGGDSDSEDEANGKDGGKRARGAAASGGEGGDESPRTESDAEANAESGDEGADAAESDREIADMDKVKRSSARKIRAADSANGEAEDEDEEDREGEKRRPTARAMRCASRARVLTPPRLASHCPQTLRKRRTSRSCTTARSPFSAPRW